MAYVTPKEVREYLGINRPDALFADFISQAQAAIDAYCDRTFEATADSTRYFNAVGKHITCQSLFVSDFHDLCAITEIVNGDGETVAADTYTTYPKTLTAQTPVYHQIKLLSNAVSSWTYTDDYENAIAITGRWSYSVTAPEAIKLATLRYVSFLYRQKDAPLQDVTAIEQGAVIRPLGMPPDVAMILASFVRK